MLRFLIRRLLIIPPALLLVNFLGYAYAYLVLPIRAARIPYLAALPEPGPLLPSYLDYLKDLLTFNLGTLPGGEVSIAEVIGRATISSLGLILIALGLSIIVGVGLGLWAVKVEPRRISRWLTAVTTTGLAMPSFYIGSVLILAGFYYILQSGGDSPLPLSGFGWDLHLVLPVIALMARPTVQIMAMTANLLEAELGKRYIRTARSIGHLWQVIRRRHAMRNALAPIVLIVAGSARLLLGELILVEWLFNWPGLGNLFAQALVPASSNTAPGSLLFMNPPVVATVLMAFAAFFLVIDLVAAAVVRVVDPRLQTMEEGVGTADVVSTQSSLARRNWPLIIGGAIVLLVFVVALVGPMLAQQDPLEEHTIIQTEDGWETAPFPILTVPGFPLGSDERGRDMLSRILWGVRPTMLVVLVVALVRLVLGTVIGITSGWSRGNLGRILDAFIAGALAVPVLMVALAAIAAMGLEVGVAAFLIGLSITGWAETARLVREQTRLVRGQQYIEAAHALGLSDLRIMAQHVLRQVMPMVWMLLALEISGTLMAMAGLGFLGYYMGGDVWVEVADFVAVRMSGMPELGQMLATANTGVTRLGPQSLPWAMVAVGTVIFVIVLGFNLLGQGLRRRQGLERSRRRSAFAEAIVRRWDEFEVGVVYPAFGWVRGHALVTALAAVMIFAIAGGSVWWRVQASKPPEVPGVELEVPGGHLWSAEGSDPYGTMSVTAPGPSDPAIAWTFEDKSGFSGGPAIGADGTVYALTKAKRFYALDPDGNQIWKAQLDAQGVGAPALDAGGNIYVADKEGGVACYTPDGEKVWRFQSDAGKLSTTGPVVAPDGTIYYALGSKIQAVSPEGEHLWSALAPALHRTAPPALSPSGDMLFWQDVIFDPVDGSLVDLGFENTAEAYFTGGDGRIYLRSGHNITQWRQTESGPEVIETTRWDARGMGTLLTPADGGVNQEQVVWLLYSNSYEGAKVAWLDSGGRVLGAIRLPLAKAQMMGVGPDAVAYVCGGGGSRINAHPECFALVPGEEEPFWHLVVDELGETLMGGAIAEERLYVTVNTSGRKGGSLHALGEGTEMTGPRGTPKAEQEQAPSPSTTGEPGSEATSEPTETGQPAILSPTATPTVHATSVPTSTVPTGAQGQVCRVLHEVKAGEYLLNIAADYDVPIKEIMKANDMNRESANKIRTGQIICIP